MHDPIRIFVDARIMGDNQDAAIFIEYFLLDERDDHPPGVTVQRGGRFVENQDLWAADNRARDRDTLLLSAESLTGRISPRPFSPTISRVFFASATDSFQLRSFKISGMATFSAVVNRGKRW